MNGFADVILPLALGGSYTYTIPQELQGSIGVGSRVIVPFGQKRIYTAIVLRLHDIEPEGYEVKSVIEVLDPHPIILSHQLELWKWIADYYLCHLGDVYRAALPTGLKLESETKVVLNPDFEADAPFSPREQRIWDILTSKQEQSVQDLQKALGVKNVLPAVHELLKKGALMLKEEIKRTFKPRLEVRVRLKDEAQFLEKDDGERRLGLLLDQLGRAKKQQEVVMKYLELSGLELYKEAQEVRPVSKKELQEASGVSAAVLKGLETKQVMEFYAYEIGRLKSKADNEIHLKELSLSQQNALNSILHVFLKKDICLLHGVTSSGKTEVYTHLIQKAIMAGKQVLYLLPEIALTTQLTERLRKIFGDRVGIYHSKYPDSTRVEIWQKQLSESPYEIILGVRSSIFLPFQHLGLVIVDEEHETSYKQQDPAPRYHARNAALMLASKYGAKTLLGTATPSIESYYNALNGRYGLVQLTQRYQGLELPEIKVVDIRDQRKKKYMNGPFSAILLGHIREALEKGEQVILFQNRRGFSPMVECKVCGWVPRCQHCDVSLNYHKGLRLLTCHYCGYTYQIPQQCPACESTELQHRGYGTERIEDIIQLIFPEARVARMDQDTTRSRTAYERIITDFQKGDTDILIGTQMVTKGLDFENVSVVGILDADQMTNIPDFRAFERAYQMMAQVAGRAGRHGHRGLVVLQTCNVQLPVIQQVVANDFLGMYDQQVEERELFRYPPFYRMINVYLKHRDEEELSKVAGHAADLLCAAFGKQRILGPDKPVVPRVQNLYIRKLIIKLEQTAPLAQVRNSLRVLIAKISEQNHGLTIYCDVDPQ